MSIPSRAALIGLLAGLSLGLGVARSAAAPLSATCLARSSSDLPEPSPGSPVTVPGRLGTTSLELVPALLTDSSEPELVLAQRAIQRNFPTEPKPEAQTEPYTYVDVPGWKSPSQAAALSFVIPGTGQLYTGSSRAYLFLGFEAIALLSYAKFGSDRDDKRDEYFAYAGDPNDADSRFSFSRLSSSVDAAEMARLHAIYDQDRREFYDLVSTNDRYLAGWTSAGGDPADVRAEAQALADDTDRLGRKSRIGLFAAIANHLVSAADALRLARLNNIALQDNLSLKIRCKPGAHSSYSATLTRKF